MDRIAILEGLKEIMSPYISDKSLLASTGEATKLIDDLSINSAHIVDIILDIENKFNITLAEKDMEVMDTVGHCITIVEKKLAANAGGA
jgi:acyl carrier protein